jgi:PAS domain S-box-containing protein
MGGMGECMDSDSRIKQLEQELADSPARLVSLLKDSPDVTVYFKDLESRIIWANDVYVRKHSLTSLDELLGKTDFDLFLEEHARAAFEDEQAIIKTGISIQDKEEKESWPDGTATWALTSKMPLFDGEGNIVGTCGLSRDITSQKTVEKQLHQARKLESLGILAGGIAHDFSNLLTIMKGHIELAMMVGTKTDMGNESLDEVNKAVDRAADLTDNLLVYAGRGRLTFSDVDLADVVSRTSGLLSSSVGENVTINGKFDNGKLVVYGDSSQLEQVAMNLILNAADAIDGGEGHVTVKTSSFDCDEAFFEDAQPAPNMPAGRYHCLEVTDTGCGMDTETMSKVFDPFFTTKSSGKGLGLASILGIARSHKGAIKVKSVPGEGTTFQVLFPAC